MSTIFKHSSVQDAQVNQSDPILSESPIHFFVSRYAIAMVVMVIITNRIQHVCTPYGRPAQISPKERILLRLPSIGMLSFASFRLLQAMCADTSTPSAQNWLQYLRPWIPAAPGHLEPSSLLWTALLSACVAQCVSTAVRSLELTSSQEDPSTFNLVGFGFILYLHAHARQFTPNAHVYLIVISRIVELLGMNLLLCRKPPLISRLTYTMLLNSIMTVHYLYTVYCSDEYPIIHSGGRLMEVCIVAMIAMTIGLHLLTMYFVDGRIDLHRLFFHRSTLPRPTDDFSLAVLKLGTACLHATKLTGFSCEFPTLEAPLRTYVELYPDGRTIIEQSIEDLEEIEAKGRFPFEKEIKDVRVILEHSGVEMGGVVRGADGMRAMSNFFGTLFEIIWTVVREAGLYVSRFLPTPPTFVQQLPRYVRLFWHGTNGEAERTARIAREQLQKTQALRMHQRLDHLRQQRSLHAAQESEMNGLDPLELVALAEEAQNPEDAASFHETLIQHMLRSDTSPPLTRSAYKQLAEPSSLSLSDSGFSALFARSRLSYSKDSDQQTRLALIQLLQERRKALRANAPNEYDRERLRLCVVCCSEERTIICWPCRCVALCNTCRDTMANKQHALLALQTAHRRSMPLCPTCRTPVAAYSRLFLP
ncbi:hypothetical protein MYAM1_003725 [Malassezia yamatoensis]|uniref:RING-type domain-containing protein n=1 Tax=Malassezia yamatoensis TaxID=253288 RepID=A0AAJ5YWB1_9BASI|nr:hypothetical protein MYAM1_003725 [Malassezia yamatoensis]